MVKPKHLTGDQMIVAVQKKGKPRIPPEQYYFFPFVLSYPHWLQE
jgi:hypothetical protein